MEEVDTGEPAKVTPTAGQTVPLERFQTVAAERKELRATVARLTAEAEALKPRLTAADTATAELTSVREELGLARAGFLDAEGVTVARAIYGALPAEERPATIVDFVASLKADGAVVPKSLAPWIAPPVATPAADPAKAKAEPMPKAPASPGTLPASGEVYSASAIRALRLEAVRTGDWSKVSAAMPSLDAATQKKAPRV